MTLSLPVLCGIIYFCSYITRLNYSTVLVEIMSSEGFSLTEASFPVTALFIAYGAGQIICGYIGDRIAPYKEVFIGLLTSCIMCCLVPLIHSPKLIAVTWAINGFAQAMIWPPIIKIIAFSVPKDEYGKSILHVNAGGSVGTISMCLLGPVIIKFASWRILFYITAAVALFVDLIWLGRMKNSKPIQNNPKTDTEIDAGTEVKQNFCYVLCSVIFTVIIIEGILRDGITTWFPVMLVDTFKLSNESSIFISVALPLFSFIAFSFATYVNKHYLPNEIQGACFAFLIATVMLFVLYLFNGKGVVITIILITVSVALAHCINLLLISLLPRRLFHYGHASLIAGVLNAGVYVGSAVSAFGIAVFTEKNGWNSTILLWAVLAFLGALICAFCTKPWSREMSKG